MTAPPGDRSASPATGRDSFVGADGPVDVAVIIVTYNSGADVGTLISSLRAEQSVRMRVVVVDNDSTDDTVAVLSEHSDVIVRSSGGNLGYAGGINLALRHVGHARSILVLNPDLLVNRGSVREMLTCLESTGAGIIVPRLLDPNGVPQASLRREPTVSRSFGEALFGDRARRRPGWLAETVYDQDSYARPHAIEWATGAALLIDGALADRLGNWDERYFLYSEETDYFRRARNAGATIWYDPAATVTHRQGGSGESPGQSALMSVNRVRYAERHGTPVAAALVHIAVTLRAALRGYRATERHTLTVLLDRRRWVTLPHATTSAASTIGSDE